MTQFEAQTACERRNNSFLPRVTDSSVQNWLRVFRTSARSDLGSNGFWIAVKSVSISSFHWIDGSPLAGLLFSVLIYLSHHHYVLVAKSVYYYYFFDPVTQFPGNEKKLRYAIQRVQKSSWNEPYSRANIKMLSTYYMHRS